MPSRDSRRPRVQALSLRVGRILLLYLGISKTQANLLIQLLVEFGPGYFELAQLIRVSPETYRAVATAIRDGNIHYNGEAIALTAENAVKIAAAIAGLRRAAVCAAKSAPKPALPSPDPILALQQRCAEMVQEFATLSSTSKYRERVAAVLSDFQTRLERIASQI